MAPRTKLSQLPSCDQVIYNPTTRKFEAPHAVVRAITREAGVDETRTVNSREITYFVSPSGTGTGASASDPASFAAALSFRSEEHTSELQSLMRISYAVFCLQKKNTIPNTTLTRKQIQLTGIHKKHTHCYEIRERNILTHNYIQK